MGGERELKTGTAPAGKPISITAAIQGGDVKPLDLPADTTVEEALRAADMEHVITSFADPKRRFQVFLHGRTLTHLKDRLTDGAEILVVGNVKGGR